MIYKCTNFELHELLPPQILSLRGEKGWELLDWAALRTLDLLRERYGPITVNNWHWNGPRYWSGLRTPDSPYFSHTSQHTFGRAFDCIFKNIPAEEVRQDILADPTHLDFQLIGAIELNVGWFHFDARNCDAILTFNA